MFSSPCSHAKLKTNLRLAVQRLKLLEKKKTELALKARKEISDYISSNKLDRARIKVEVIIREDYLVEAMEAVEMYCDILLARFGLLESQSQLDRGLDEAVSTLIWVAPRFQAEVAEFKVIAEQLSLKYGKEFSKACLANSLSNVNSKVMHKLSVADPPCDLVEMYMVEISKSFNVNFEPDKNLLEGGSGGTGGPNAGASGGGSGTLIDFEDNPKTGFWGIGGNSFDPHVTSAIPPLPPGFGQLDPHIQPMPGSHILPPDKAIDSELPPAYEPSPITFYPQTDFKTPYPTVSSSGKPPSLLTASSLPPPLPTTDPVAPPDFVLPILPSVPTSSTNNMGGQGGVSGMTSSSSSHQDESDELRFDDLSRRFQQLKGKK